MGMIQYHRQFIPGFSHISKLIFATLKKGQVFKWTKEVEDALDTLIKKITDDPYVSHPNPNKPFELEIDASNYAMGAILIQRGENVKHIEVGYFSKALDAHEKNYDVYDREFLALINALHFWRHFLEDCGYTIKVYTDHYNLTRHREVQKLSGKLSRQISFIARFELKFYHLPGKANIVADALSMSPSLNGSD